MIHNPNWGRAPKQWESWAETEGVRTLTGTTLQTVMWSVLIPGNLLRDSGGIRIWPLYGASGIDTDDKRFRIKFGGQLILEPSASAFDALGMVHPLVIPIYNTAYNAQLTTALTGYGTTSGSALQTLSVDTSVDQLLEFTGQLQDPNDILSLKGEVEIKRG